MPAAAPINPDLILAIFSYDPITGALIPKPTANAAARKTDKQQWEVGAYRYSLHRLVWAWHNPKDANPYAVQFHDGDKTNTRIENLYPIPTHPRWVGHIKQIKAKIDQHGNVIINGAPPAPAPVDKPAQLRMSQRLNPPMRNEPIDAVALIREAERESNTRVLERITKDWDAEETQAAQSGPTKHNKTTPNT
jgi:hypothetical protein